MNKKTYFLLAFAGILVVLTIINLVYLKISISLIESGKKSKLERQHIIEKVNNDEIISLRSRKEKENKNVETGKEYKHPNNVLPPITTDKDSNKTVDVRPQAAEPHPAVNESPYHQANNTIDSDNVVEPHKHTEPLEEDKYKIQPTPTPIVINQTVPVQPLTPRPASNEDEPFHYSDKDNEPRRNKEPVLGPTEPLSKAELKVVQESSLTIPGITPTTEVIKKE